MTFTDPMPAAAIVGAATKLSTMSKAYDNTFALREASRRYVDLSSVGNVGGGEDDLISRTLAAEVLAANDDGLRITQWGTFGAAGGTDVIVLRSYFGGSLLKIDEAATSFDLAAASGAGTMRWNLETLIFRTGASAQAYRSILTRIAQSSARSVYCGAGTLAVSTAGTIIVKCTGEVTSATSSRIVQEGMLIETINNPL